MKFLRLTLFLTSAVLNSVYAEVKYFSKCIHEKDFAITFDDGPSLDYTSKVLDVLDEFHVKATFFINGNNCVNILENKTARVIININIIIILFLFLFLFFYFFFKDI